MRSLITDLSLLITVLLRGPQLSAELRIHVASELHFGCSSPCNTQWPCLQGTATSVQSKPEPPVFISAGHGVPCSMGGQDRGGQCQDLAQRQRGMPGAVRRGICYQYQGRRPRVPGLRAVGVPSVCRGCDDRGRQVSRAWRRLPPGARHDWAVNRPASPAVMFFVLNSLVMSIAQPDVLAED